jgi:hypothetical protein
MITAQELIKKKAEKDCKVWLECIEKKILAAENNGFTFCSFLVDDIAKETGVWGCCYSADLAQYLKKAYGFRVELIEGYKTDSLVVSWL